MFYSYRNRRRWKCSSDVRVSGRVLPLSYRDGGDLGYTLWCERERNRETIDGDGVSVIR